jgi:hypothetical protein
LQLYFELFLSDTKEPRKPRFKTSTASIRTIKIALISARGSNKPIPRKNIRSFGGQPINFWPIAAAEQCGLFDLFLMSPMTPTLALWRVSPEHLTTVSAHII